MTAPMPAAPSLGALPDNAKGREAFLAVWSELQRSYDYTKRLVAKLDEMGREVRVNVTKADGDHLHTGVYEPVFTHNTGFNLDLGTTAGTVSEGDHTHAFGDAPPSVMTGITAHAGGGQANAVALTADSNLIDTVASPGDSVKLAGASDGKRTWVKNVGAVSCDVFPASGEQIDSLGTNNAYALAADASVLFIGTATNRWMSV